MHVTNREARAGLFWESSVLCESPDIVSGYAVMSENYRLTYRSRLRSEAVFVAVVVALFVVVEAVGLWHHEMWRDELQAWLIARDSASLTELFSNLRYERHPALWHLILYVVTRATSNPVAMQLVHLVIATASVFLFVRHAPFTKLQKALFPFGYFPLFEYGIISRSYSLGVLLMFTFCLLFVSAKRNYVAASVVLVLLANVNLHALIIAAALSPLLMFKICTQERSDAPQRVRALVVCALVVSGGICAGLAQIIPPPPPYRADTAAREILPDAVKDKLVPNSDNKAHALRAFKTVQRAYLPIPDFTNYNFWETDVLDLLNDESVARRCALVLSFFLLACSISCFVSRPLILGVYLTGTFALGLFSYLLFIGFMRHHGHLFVLFILCLWLSAQIKPNTFFATKAIRVDVKLEKCKSLFLSVLLAVHCLVGFYVVAIDVRLPFSTTRQVADFIKRQGWSDVTITGTPDFSVSPLSAYLNTDIYYLERGEAGTFMRWDYRRSDISSSEAYARLSALAARGERDILFISHGALPINDDDVLPFAGHVGHVGNEAHRLRRIRYIASFGKAIQEDETYYLYFISK